MSPQQTSRIRTLALVGASSVLSASIVLGAGWALEVKSIWPSGPSMASETSPAEDARASARTHDVQPTTAATAALPGTQVEAAASTVLTNEDEPAPNSIAGIDLATSAASPAVRQQVPPAVDPTLAIADLRQQMASLRGTIAELQRQLEVLERTTRDGLRADTTDSDPKSAAPQSGTAQDRRALLMRAGATPDLAQDIVERQSELALARLDLQDQAMREGWHDTPRYRRELASLRELEVDLRTELDPATFDRYLYESGRPNRMQIAEIVEGSTAELYGLAPGDVIESYAEQPVFSVRELLEAIAKGERGTAVTMRIRRGDQLFELQVPRGPVGVRLDPVSVPALN